MDHSYCVKKENFKKDGKIRDKESCWLNYFVYRIYRTKINQSTFHQFIQYAPILHILPNEIVFIIILYFDSPVYRLVHLTQNPNLEFENLILGHWFLYYFRAKNTHNNIVLNSSGNVKISLTNQGFTYSAHLGISCMDDYLQNQNTTCGKLEYFPNKLHPLETYKMELQGLKRGERKSTNFFSEYYIIRIGENPKNSFVKIKNLFHTLRKQIHRRYRKYNIFKLVHTLKSLLKYKDILFVSRNQDNWEDIRIFFLFHSDLIYAIQELQWIKFS